MDREGNQTLETGSKEAFDNVQRFCFALISLPFRLPYGFSWAIGFFFRFFIASCCVTMSFILFYSPPLPPSPNPRPHVVLSRSCYILIFFTASTSNALEMCVGSSEPCRNLQLTTYNYHL